MKVYSLMNQKGGVGKTTVAVNLAHGLHMDGFRVLLIDADSQRNTTMTAYAGFPNESDYPYSTYDIFFNSKEELQEKGIDIHDMIIHTEDCDLIPASNKLSAIEPQIVGRIGKEYRLAQTLAKIEEEYDFAIIDTPPVIGTISVNVIVASDGIIIPVNADSFSLSALGDIYMQINTVNEYIRKDNPVHISGILQNEYVINSSANRDTEHNYKEASEVMGVEIFNTKIRRCSTINKAQVAMENLWKYTYHLPKKESYVFNGVKDYLEFIEELLKKDGLSLNGKLSKYMKANGKI